MDKTDYNDKMDSVVNDKQTYEVLKRDPVPALQRKLNNKLLTLKKTDKIDFRRYNRLRCSAATQAVWTIKTAQTQHTYGAHSFFLWVPDLPTV